MTMIVCPSGLAGQIRGLAIILAAFAEGLGVLAIVVGLLAIFIKA